MTTESPSWVVVEPDVLNDADAFQAFFDKHLAEAWAEAERGDIVEHVSLDDIFQEALRNFEKRKTTEPYRG